MKVLSGIQKKHPVTFALATGFGLPDYVKADPGPGKAGKLAVSGVIPAFRLACRAGVPEVAVNLFNRVRDPFASKKLLGAVVETGLVHMLEPLLRAAQARKHEIGQDHYRAWLGTAVDMALAHRDPLLLELLANHGAPVTPGQQATYERGHGLVRTPSCDRALTEAVLRGRVVAPVPMPPFPELSAELNVEAANEPSAAPAPARRRAVF
jgi:hypothetical protein